MCSREIGKRRLGTGVVLPLEEFVGCEIPPKRKKKRGTRLTPPF